LNRSVNFDVLLSFVRIQDSALTGLLKKAIMLPISL